MADLSPEDDEYSLVLVGLFIQYKDNTAKELKKLAKTVIRKPDAFKASNPFALGMSKADIVKFGNLMLTYSKSPSGWDEFALFLKSEASFEELKEVLQRENIIEARMFFKKENSEFNLAYLCDAEIDKRVVDMKAMTDDELRDAMYQTVKFQQYTKYTKPYYDKLNSLTNGNAVTIITAVWLISAVSIGYISYSFFME
jgi:hypothetical protein